MHLDKTLPLLYECTKLEDKEPKVTSTQLDRILMGCNQLIRSTGCWRSHESLLLSLAVLRQCLPYSQLFLTFVPLLKKEVLTARAIPCRIAAASTLLVYLRENPEQEERDKLVNFFLSGQFSFRPRSAQRWRSTEVVTVVRCFWTWCVWC